MQGQRRSQGSSDAAQVQQPEEGTTHLVFCYGSNGIAQLHRRTGEHCIAYPAVLEDYVRIFAGWSERWRGGVASVYPAPGQKVKGIVVELSMEGIKKLDGFEGVDLSDTCGYNREEVMVQVAGCEGRPEYVPKTCYVYIKRDPYFTHLPSYSYLNAIRTMLDEAQRAKRVGIKVNALLGWQSQSEAKDHLVTLGVFNTDGTLDLSNNIAC